jgi:adenosylcobinamide-phosphate synthase
MCCWRARSVRAPGTAGALGVSLGGAAVYDGEVEQRPPLGAGPAACAGDIQRAWRLVLRTTLLWLGVVCLLAVLTAIGAPHA